LIPYDLLDAGPLEKNAWGFFLSRGATVSEHSHGEVGQEGQQDRQQSTAGKGTSAQVHRDDMRKEGEGHCRVASGMNVLPQLDSVWKEENHIVGIRCVLTVSVKMNEPTFSRILLSNYSFSVQFSVGERNKPKSYSCPSGSIALMKCGGWSRSIW
jgi:hypothetical protein